jgi:hypothetical protein
MERVLWPMEPVEPRMANFFTFFIFADERLLAGKTALVGVGWIAAFYENGRNFVVERVEGYRRVGWSRDPSLRSAIAG